MKCSYLKFNVDGPIVDQKNGASGELVNDPEGSAYRTGRLQP